MKGVRKPILRFVPCKDGGINLGVGQLAPYELCATCPHFEGETEDGLGIFCSKGAGSSVLSVFREAKKKLGGLLGVGRKNHA